MPSRALLRALAGLAVVLASASSLSAQGRPTEQDRPTEEAEEGTGGQTALDEERRYDDLAANFQKEYLRFTTLLQIAPDFPFAERENNQPSIGVAAAWLGIGGRLGEDIGYFLRGNLANSPALLEAYVSYGSDDARGIVGRQKVPFSYEFLTPAADIDFVNRARVVRDLAPGRETGLALRLASPAYPLTVRMGVFNANYDRTLEDTLVTQRQRGGALLAARAQVNLASDPNDRFVVGANLAYDTPDTSDQVDVPARLLAGVDARFRIGPILLAAEALLQRVDDTREGDAEGGYLTAGYDVSPVDRLLVRLDHLGRSDELLLGYNRTLTRAASFQANLAVPLDDQSADGTRALLNFQLAF